MKCVMCEDHALESPTYLARKADPSLTRPNMDPALVEEVIGQTAHLGLREVRWRGCVP